MAKKADTAAQILDAALTLAAEQGWRNVTMPEIAARATLPLPDLYGYAPGKNAVLDRLGRMVDEKVLAGGETDPDDDIRDRLFDLLMRRFDALNEHRQGFRAVIEDLRRDPPVALCQVMGLERGMRWTLEHDTEDMARTMATLDRRLRQAEQLADLMERGPRLPGRGGRSEPAAEQA